MDFQKIILISKKAVLHFFATRHEEIEYTLLGFTLLILPMTLFFYGDVVYCKLSEIRHRFRMKKICEEPSLKGLSLSEDERPDNFLESEANKFKDNPGNFLSLAYGVDNQLRFAACEIMRKQYGEDTDKEEIYDIVEESGILTKYGVKKIKFIAWLRDTVQAGRTKYLSDKTLQMGVCTTWELHQELNLWLRSKKDQNKFS